MKAQLEHVGFFVHECVCVCVPVPLECVFCRPLLPHSDCFFVCLFLFSFPPSLAVLHRPAGEGGQQALECLRKSQVDLILVEVEMPEVDGLTILKSLKEENAQVSVIS